MEKLLPDQLKAAWQALEDGQLALDEFNELQEQALEACRALWRQALLQEGERDLQRGLLAEIGTYVACGDLTEIQRRCEQGSSNVARDWSAHVKLESRPSVERFYDQSEAYIYDLTWWHTLSYDSAPLAYVIALQFAEQRGCGQYLDFGSGVGAGAILFASHNFEVALADISSTLLHFSEWQLERRGVVAQLIDLKTGQLPNDAFDFVTAMDVFEHLVDPLVTVDQLHRTLKRGGFLFGRFHAERDDSSSSAYRH